ncbi:unnamed protein product [Protopolystoma xenopodis]|uniref:Uncharacterized protein n=1 Tax=Protopolystoma xenopodis TaxID=117903 RepID=A0A448XRD4_9PLAT|nr:unnamed protein product [Protopolystoma xenopodis]
MALSIFGAVGGPILCIFTLGMFFPFINSKGGSVGLIVSLVVGLLFGLMPNVIPAINVPSDLSFSLDDCSPNNKTVTPSYVNGSCVETITTISTTVTPAAPDLNPYLKAFRISYLYYSHICGIIGFIVALLVSAITVSFSLF